jgi:hypothetical protein
MRAQAAMKFGISSLIIPVPLIYYSTCLELGTEQPSLDTRHSIYAHCAILPAQTTVNGGHWTMKFHDGALPKLVRDHYIQHVRYSKVLGFSTETSTIFESTGSANILLGDVLAGASSCQFWPGCCVGTLFHSVSLCGNIYNFQSAETDACF